MSPRRALQLVSAGRFMALLPEGAVHPSCERQVRPLLGLPQEVALRIWALAARRTGGTVPSERIVRECAAELAGAEEETGNEGAGEQVHHELGAGVEHEQGPGLVFFQSASNEWYTPEAILSLVRQLFVPGGISLDPCSCESANARVGAAQFYDKGTDGLLGSNAWTGNVYVNPPFGTREGKSLQALFYERCKREYEAGNIAQALLLIKAGVGYQWFKSVLGWPVCFLFERVSFVRGQRTGADALQWGSGLQNPNGSVVVYMGPNVTEFALLFSTVGSVPGFNAWAYPQGMAAPGAEED